MLLSGFLLEEGGGGQNNLDISQMLGIYWLHINMIPSTAELLASHRVILLILLYFFKYSSEGLGMFCDDREI